MKEDHLDPEVVAAWADGSLDPSARAAAEAHAADCLRCQAVLAAMVRTEPLAAAPRPGWFRAPLRWAVPLATAAAALALWIAVPRESAPPETLQVASRGEESPRALADRPAQAPAPIPAAAPPATPPVTPPKRSEEPALKQEALGQDAASRARPAPQVQGPPQEKPAVVVDTVSTPVDELRRDPLAGRGAPPAATPPAAASPPPPAQQQQQQQQQPVGVLTETTVQTARQSSAAFSADAVALRGVASPDPAVRYRSGAKGLIQRSTDGGRSWVTQDSGVKVALTAASAPSPTVCWVVGRSGVVLRSIDGTTWHRVPFPDQRDLREVTAEDAHTASVTTVDGRVWRTTDGGATWTRQAP